MGAVLSTAERYRKARNEAGLSQDGAARAIGCSKGAVQTWESGDRVPGEARLLIGAAKAYGVSTDYLLGLTDDPTPHWATSGPDDPALAEDLAAIDDLLAHPPLDEPASPPDAPATPPKRARRK